MSRSTKKGPYVHPSLWEKVLANQAPQNRQIIRTWSRSSVVLPEMVGMTIAVH
ncbi:MAG: ribosomal protein S19 family protein, partial [Solirubrobacterales bacterium]|nr:ribosomal protein S19 family protein [Solirubrobacterales bacterium]